VPTIDPRVWRATEPGTPPPHQRLRAMRVLVDGGVRAGVALAPVLPGISDSPAQLTQVIRAAREAGACNVWTDVVNLRPGTREHFLSELEHEWPGERARYERMFEGRSYLPGSAGDELRRQVAALKARFGIADRRADRLEPPEEPAQLELRV
jgi:DNA repair photolyase